MGVAEQMFDQDEIRFLDERDRRYEERHEADERAREMAVRVAHDALIAAKHAEDLYQSHSRWLIGLGMILFVQAVGIVVGLVMVAR